MIYWIWLTQIPFIGLVTARYLIKELGDAEKIYQADYETLSGMSGLSARQRESIIRNHSLEKAKRIMDDCQNKNISILCWNDERYPLRAREPADAPPMLYYKGNIKKMDQTVGIVGAAILGNGLDICYPSEHHKLMKCIEEKGLLLSEYPPGTPPSRYTFPRRNRLISSWSDKLIIIQAGKGSGALTTAEYSRKYGRKVEMKAEIMKAEI